MKKNVIVSLADSKYFSLLNELTVNALTRDAIPVSNSIMENGLPKDISIKEGDIFLLPPQVPHSPQRYENTVGLVIEYKRKEKELDGFQWYCDECYALLYEDFFHLTNIVKQLPIAFEKFWSDSKNRTCKKCNSYLKKV